MVYFPSLLCTWADRKWLLPQITADPLTLLLLLSSWQLENGSKLLVGLEQGLDSQLCCQQCLAETFYFRQKGDIAECLQIKHLQLWLENKRKDGGRNGGGRHTETALQVFHCCQTQPPSWTACKWLNRRVNADLWTAGCPPPCPQQWEAVTRACGRLRESTLAGLGRWIPVTRVSDVLWTCGGWLIWY